MGLPDQVFTRCSDRKTQKDRLSPGCLCAIPAKLREQCSSFKPSELHSAQNPNPT